MTQWPEHWTPNDTTTKRTRLGIYLWYTGDPENGYVTVHKIVYGECAWRIADVNNTFTVSGVAGSYNGAVDYTFPSDYSTITVFPEQTENVNLSYGEETVKSASASITGIDYIGASYTASVYAEITLPARPYDIPSPQTNLVATRISDTRVDLAWDIHPTAAAPYQSQPLERETGDSDEWVQVTSGDSDDEGYSNTTTTGNHYYRYRARAYNSAGYSAYVYSDYVYMTPAAPGNCVAEKTGTSEVTITCDDNSNTESGFEWQYSTDGGTTPQALDTTGEGVTTCVHSDAPGGSIVYRVRATRGGLVSGWSSWSNAVTTLCAPATPTVTSGWGAYEPTGATLRISWQHNTLDGSAQSKADITYNFGGSDTTVQVTGTQNYYDIPITGQAAATAVSAKVRTYGLHANPSPYSAVHSTTLADEPQCNITTPATDGTVIDDAPLTAAWDYTDEFAQAGWTLRLYKSGVLVKTWTGTTAASQQIGIEYLADDSSFSLDLEVRSGSGFTGSATRTFTTDYLAPTIPAAYATFDPVSLSCSVVAYAGETSELPATDHLALLRIDSYGGETTIEVLADPLTEGAVFPDYVPRLNQDVTYRVLAVAANGAYSYIDAIAATRARGYHALNYHDGGGSLLPLRWNVKAGSSATDDSETLLFAERALAVTYAGEHTEETVRLTATLTGTAEFASYRALKQWRRACTYRDPRGYRAHVKLVRFSANDGETRPPTLAVSLDMQVVE